METGINIISKEQAYVSTDDTSLIRRIRKLADENHGMVHVIKQPEDNDGCWYGIIPTKWVRITPPRKVEYTDEQKAIMAERLRNSLNKSKEEA